MLKLTDPSLLRAQLYIDGAWVDADDGSTVSVLNPATQEEIVAIPNAGAPETRRAIEAANKAFISWRNVVAKERSAILKRWFTLIMENQEDLARLMTAEQGKPLAESRGEVAYGAAFVEWFAEEGRRVYGDTIPRQQPQPAHRHYQAAHRRCGRDHALELPYRNDHAQGRTGTSGRLHNCTETCN